jgi:hypothetical protein
MGKNYFKTYSVQALESEEETITRKITKRVCIAWITAVMQSNVHISMYR